LIKESSTFTGLRTAGLEHPDLANPAIRFTSPPSSPDLEHSRRGAAPQVPVRPRDPLDRTPVRRLLEISVNLRGSLEPPVKRERLGSQEFAF